MNNLNFSKNVFGGGQETKIAGRPINSYSQDGGRRSVEDVRQEQLNADRGINPDAGKEFQTEIVNSAYQKPLSTSNMTGAFINKENSEVPSSKSYGDVQMDATRTRIQSLQNLNKRGF